MADITLPQTVPSALLDGYKKALGEARSGKRVFKRYPFRVPVMQTKGGNPSAKQKEQRLRFIEATKKFASVDNDTRERWYAAMPEYHSLLWYYNYFIMSSLLGNANLEQGGAGVIKSIQHKLITIPAGTGEGSVVITTIDPAKAVVMVNGSSIAIDDEGGVFFTSQVYPYVSSLAAALLKLKWALSAPYYSNTKSATVSATIIEYI